MRHFIDDNEAWKDEAACIGDSDFTKPIVRSAAGFAEYKRLKAICDRCPVKTMCHEYGKNESPYIIWGGQLRNFEDPKKHRVFVVVKNEGE